MARLAGTQIAMVRNVALWHKVRAQLGPFEGTKTAALPTLGIEGQFSTALQTWFSAAANAYC